MLIEGLVTSECGPFEVVVRCTNLLAYAEKALAGGGDIKRCAMERMGRPHATSVLDNTDLRWGTLAGLVAGDSHESERDADTFHRGRYPQIHRR